MTTQTDEQAVLAYMHDRLRYWRGNRQHASLETSTIRRKLDWTPARTRHALRSLERQELVTSLRKGGRTHGRPLWWTLTEKGADA